MPVLTKRTLMALFCLSLIWSACTKNPAAREAGFVAKGKRYLAQKDYSRAALELSNATTLKPNDAEAWYLLGTAYLGLNDVYRSVPAQRDDGGVDFGDGG